MENYVNQEKNKIELFKNSFPKELKKTIAIPSAEDMSALYSTAYEVENEAVYCAIYVYEKQQEHETARKFLKNNPNTQAINQLVSSNGGLFFVGYQKSDNPNANYTLNALASAFAGEE